MITPKETQLELFHLAPRDEGRSKVDWTKGGIKKITIQRFKRFRFFETDFDRITLMVGTNSSGKTTLLQAIRLFFWCINVCLRKNGNGSVFEKTVIPFSDFHLIPAHVLRELSFQGITPNRRSLGIVLQGTLESGLTLSFRIYASYSTLMVVAPEGQMKISLQEHEVASIDRAPLYIPGFFGVVTRELLAHDARLEELLNSGHHNEVLRNIILRLKGDPGRLAKLFQIMKQEFRIMKMDLPFSEKTTEFLRAEYSEPELRIPFDFVSAGSGFLQVLQIMAHALQNPSPILLLDEPDAHMHHSLQRSFLRFLRAFADAEKLQVIMASHSETFLRETPLEEVRVIDSSWVKAGKYPNVIDLQSQLAQTGIWPSRLELAEIMRTRRVLVVEGEVDEQILNYLGRVMFADWDSMIKLLQIVYSEGSDDSTVHRLQYAKEILARVIPDGIRIAHFRDRDLMCDAAVSDLRKEAKEKRLPLFVTEYRNCETQMVQPELVEKAIRKEYQGKIPLALENKGAIANLVKEQLFNWCNSELDDMPVKIIEYNRSWLRRTYENKDMKIGEKRIAEFIRKSWHEPISSHDIPWVLVDGKAVLRAIRRKLQEFSIVLTGEAIMQVMENNDFDDNMRKSVSLVHDWCSPVESGS